MKRVLFPRLASAALIVLAPFGCGIIDLRPVLVDVRPGESGAILATATTPITVAYDAEPNRQEAEAAFSVYRGDASVSGDISWDGPAMSFKPVPDWIPGSRYQLRLSGKVRMKDGRTVTLNDKKFFTAVTAQGGARLASTVPADGATYLPGSPLVFTFDTAMDRMSVESALGISPSAEMRYSWDATGRVLSAAPVDQLKALECYAWRFDSSAKSLGGSLLLGTPHGRFYVDADVTPPFVTGAVPASRSGTTWTATGTTLEGMAGDSAILISFSEPVTWSSLESSLSIAPSVQGTLEMATESSCVFVPADGYLPGVEYVLVAKAGIEDLAGLLSQQEWRQEFGTSAYYFSVTRLSSDDSDDGALTDFTASPPVFNATVANPVTGDLQLEIEFSEALTTAAQADFQKRLSLRSYFPTGTVTPALKSIQWNSTTIVDLNYEDFTRSDATVDRYYELTVQGGEGGLRCGTLTKPSGGAWMEKDFKVMVRAKRSGE